MSDIYRTTVALDSCFANSKKELGLYRHDQFDIDLTDWTPFSQRPYAMSPADLEFTRSEVKGLCEVGVADPCISHWGFASLVVHRLV